jgi:hypothetical protein
MIPVGFERTISAGERLQTYALDRAATGTGILQAYIYIKLLLASTFIGHLQIKFYS